MPTPRVHLDTVDFPQIQGTVHVGTDLQTYPSRKCDTNSGYVSRRLGFAVVTSPVTTNRTSSNHSTAIKLNPAHTLTTPSIHANIESETSDLTVHSYLLASRFRLRSHEVDRKFAVSSLTSTTA